MISAGSRKYLKPPIRESLDQRKMWSKINKKTSLLVAVTAKWTRYTIQDLFSLPPPSLWSLVSGLLP